MIIAARRSIKTAVCAAVLAMTTTVAGVAQACLHTSVGGNTLALSVRTLQSDLMVSALSCNDRALYNAFAVKFRPNLKVHGDALKDHFKQMHGGKAKAKLNTYVTDLANYASVRHAQDNTSFCGGARSAFRALLDDGGQDLRTVSLAYAMQVSPSLRDEIALAASSAGCDVVARGKKVVVAGVTVLD